MIPPRRPGSRLSHRSRKLLRTTHTLCSVGWFGAAVLVAVLALTAAGTGDRTLAHALYRSIDASLAVTLTAGILALATGVALSVGTHFGLLQQWWVTTKLTIALAVIATDVLVIHHAVGEALHAPSAPRPLFGATVAHTVVLAAATVIAIYKPWGPTPRGRRKASARLTDSSPPRARTPVPPDR